MKIIGMAMVVAVFMAVFIAAIFAIGFWPAVGVFAATGFLVGWLALAAHLMHGGKLNGNG